MIGSLDQPKRERKVFWKSLKVIEHVKTQSFQKLSLRCSIDWKLDSINRKCPRLIQKQSSSDRNGQIQTKILIAFSISRATSSIGRKSRKIKFLKNRAVLCRNSLKHSILWIKCMSMRWNAFQKQLYWIQISQN